MLKKLVLNCVDAVLSLVALVVNPLLHWIFSLIYDGSATTVPSIEDEVILMSATKLSKKIRKREVTAVSVMETYINRVKMVTPLVNAVIADRFEEALAEAKAVDELLDGGQIEDKYSETNAPFLGVPLSVKEAFGVKGMPNASGLVSRKSIKSEADCPVISCLKKAGAIPFVMTNVSELCMWYESANRLYGRTKNAYNTGRIVGGSSGGEGCNLSSGGGVIGVGSDIGGSIRMPAFFNGIFGHRPSRGVVPNDGQFPIPTGKDMELLCTGPMCRYAEDLLPQLRIMAGTNVTKLKLDNKVDLRKLKFVSIEDDGGSLTASPVDPQLKEAQRRVVKYLEDSLGVKVQHLIIPKLKYSVDMWASKMTTSGGAKFCEYMADKKGSVNPFLEFCKWLVGCSNHTLPAIGLGMIEKVDWLLEGTHEFVFKSFDKLDEELKSILGDNGILLYPSHPKIAPYHNLPICYPFNFGYTAIFNALGLPVTQVPLGLSKEGLPLGIQVISSMYNDHLPIAVANHLEAGLGGWVSPGKQEKYFIG